MASYNPEASMNPPSLTSTTAPVSTSQKMANLVMDRDPNAVPLSQTSSSSAYGGQAAGLGGGSFVPGTEFGTSQPAAGYGVAGASSSFPAERVIPFLLEQHQQIKALFAEVIGSSGTARAESWFRLRRLLAVHETAEEIVVHPSARKRIANGEQIIAQRLQEEGEAKQMLCKMEALDDCNGAEFNTLLHQLQAAVLAHANSEETTEFNQLDVQLDDKEACRMRKAVEMAESMGPTRPHEGLGQSATANIIGGPFVSMVDRIRDAIECRHIRKEGEQHVSHTDY